MVRHEFNGWGPARDVMKDCAQRLDTPGSNGMKLSPRSFSDVVAGQSVPVPIARQVDGFIRLLPSGLQD